MKTVKKILFFILISSIIGCSQAQKTPRFISFKLDQDSLLVFAKSKLLCPSFLKIQNLENKSTQRVNLGVNETKKIMSFLASEMDTVLLKERFLFDGLWYGDLNFSSYDTLYNYDLPFLKGKRYRILQGQNTNFTHKGDFSRYAIDFKMNIGQTICAIREGVVIKVTQKI